MYVFTFNQVKSHVDAVLRYLMCSSRCLVEMQSRPIFSTGFHSFIARHLNILITYSDDCIINTLVPAC